MLEQFEQMVNMWPEAYPPVQDYLDKGDVEWRKPAKPCEDQASDTGSDVDRVDANLGNASRHAGLFKEIHGRIRPRKHSHSRGWNIIRDGDFDSSGKPAIPRSVLLSSLPETWDGLMQMERVDDELSLSNQPEPDWDALELVNSKGGWEPASIGEYLGAIEQQIPFKLF